MATVIGRKLLHCVLRQFAERDAVLFPATDLSIAIAGLALQDLFAKAVKGVLLVFGVAIRFHVLTSLRAGRQFFSSPFAHYSFCGRLFWPALPGKIKIIFFCRSFVRSFRPDRVGGRIRRRAERGDEQKNMVEYMKRRTNRRKSLFVRLDYEEAANGTTALFREACV